MYFCATAARILRHVVSEKSDGTQSDGDSTAAAINDDGSIIAFQSDATNLSPVSTSSLQTTRIIAFTTQNEIYVHNTADSTTTKVSFGSGGVQADGPSQDASLNGDGRFALFSSSATNLVANDSNKVDDIFVHDRTANTTVRVSVAGDNTEATNASASGTINGNANFVGFTTDSNNLISNDSNENTDVFVINTQCLLHTSWGDCC